MAKKDLNQNNKKNPILWLLFVVVLPTIIAGVIIVSILMLAGVDVGGWIKEAPVISSFVKSDEEIEDEDSLLKAQEKIAEQAEEIEALNIEIKGLEDNIEQQEQDIVKLENKNNSEDNLLKEDMNDGEDGEVEVNTIKKMASSFRKMQSKQAALIFEDLDNDIALELLEELSNDVRGSILEAMEPKKAAELTKLFVEE